MSNIFNMNFGSFFPKKDTSKKETNLDEETLKLIRETPIRTMQNNFEAKNESRLSTPTPDIKNLPKIPAKPAAPTQESPFSSADFDLIPKKNETPPVIEKAPNITSEVEEKNTYLTQEKSTFSTKAPAIVPTETQKNNNPIKIFAIILSIIIIISLAGGGYYFWTLNQKPIEEASMPEEILPQIEEPASPQTNPVIPEQPKPKYLNIDPQVFSASQTIDAIKSQIAEVKASGVIKPVEFVVADMQNNPINFSAFSAKIGVVFSPEVKANLSESFSLFIYNDNNAGSGIGLAIDSINDVNLKMALLAYEKDLVSALSPILLTKPSGDTDKNTIFFGDNRYKQADVRYYNIPNANGLCVDYTVLNKKLLFGTTMFTLRSIIDNLETENDLMNNSEATDLSVPATLDEK